MGGGRSVAKLIDFGIARPCARQVVRGRCMSHAVYTIWYRPPEILLGDNAYGFYTWPSRLRP